MRHRTGAADELTGEMRWFAARVRWRPFLGVVSAVLAVWLVIHVQSADAVTLPPVTIEGPSEEIVGFGGAAMAEDGSGGVVYLKRVEGVAHVFVSRYQAGHWLAPIRVDSEEKYAASWPRIGAAEGGELVVTWATPFATEGGHPVDEMMGATLGPGATGFGPARVIDPNIGAGIGVSPDLAMSTTGQADLVYRVVESEAGKVTSIPLLRPGDVVETIRVAHYDGARWTRLGAINRDAGVSMRPPSQANAPEIAIGRTGNGVVVWQEPEITGQARIWARRIFGANLDYVLPVSATTLNGAPITGEAEAPSVAVSFLGQAEVAYRQGVAPGSALAGPRIFLNTLPDGESANGSEFTGASLPDPATITGPESTVGPPSIDVDEKRALRLLYDVNGTPRVIEGASTGPSAALSLGPAFVGPEPVVVSIMNPAGGGVSAWPSADPQGDAAVAVREDFPEGAVQTALVSGGAGGEVAELSVGRSGLGDGIVAFRQGQIGNAAIVADTVTAPPKVFVVDTPHGWIKPSQLTVSWEAAPSAEKPVTYQVVLDGRALPTPAGVLAMTIPASGISSGIHHLQVLATDADGQAVLTPPATVKIDGAPPAVSITRTRDGRGVLVKVSDSYSGVAAHSVHIDFGDGHSVRGKTHVVHEYARAGIYRVTVAASDNLGNGAVVTEPVSIK
jgi:hypothetical protein